MPSILDTLKKRFGLSPEAPTSEVSYVLNKYKTQSSKEGSEERRKVDDVFFKAAQRHQEENNALIVSNVELMPKQNAADANDERLKLSAITSFCALSRVPVPLAIAKSKKRRAFDSVEGYENNSELDTNDTVTAAMLMDPFSKELRRR